MRQRATVRVSASSANLGPAFDCAGLAYDLRDELSVEVVDGPPGIEVTAIGEGQGRVPRDGRHLVARALRLGLEVWAPQHSEVNTWALRLHCHGRIPHGRGLGSSAAAIIGGLALARALVAADSNGAASDDAYVRDAYPDDAEVLQLALQLESHPDNLAAALYGGFTLSWIDAQGRAQARSMAVHEQISAVVAVPTHRTPTGQARQALPSEVPFVDAAFNAGRSALLGVALTTDPALLFPATEDHLHQPPRESLYPESFALVTRLRADGWPAVISGAGPTVLVLNDRSVHADDAVELAIRQACGDSSWQVSSPGIAGDGVLAS